MAAPLWMNRPFVKLWLAQVASNIGDQFYSIALLWYFLQQTNSASTLSLLALPEMLAGFLFYLVGGVLADRFNPRFLMVASNVARLVVAAIVGTIVLFDVFHLSLFLLAQFLIGMFGTLFQPSRTVALKAIVPLDSLSQANAILDTTFRTIRILAPMTIGLLASAMPLFVLFFVNSGAYLLSAAFIHSIKKRLREEDSVSAAAFAPKLYLTDIRLACKEVVHKRLLLYIVIFSNLGYLGWQVCWSVGFPVMANELGHGNAGMLGILVGFYGFGNLLGSLFMARVHYTNYLLFVLIGWLFQAGGYLLMAGSQGVVGIAYAAAALSGFGGPLTGIPTVMAIQTMSADTNVGKIFSLNMLLFTFFGVLSSGLGAIWLGKLPVWQMFLGSSVFLLLMVWIGYRLGRREWGKEIQES
ncbi:MAG: MFS transporter [Clostridia bacterium]